jgi:hypothetical protein
MTRSVEAQRDERSLKEKLRYYYEADAARAHRFRYALLAFDIVTVLFIVVSSFFERTLTLEVLDVLFGIFILADFSARLFISRTRWRDLRQPATWADLVAIISFLIPMAGEGVAFLRVLRTLRLFHTYQILARLRDSTDKDGGFKVIRRRWVIERTFSWLRRNRRLMAHYEALAMAAVHFVKLAMISVMLKRLTEPRP